MFDSYGKYKEAFKRAYVSTNYKDQNISVPSLFMSSVEVEILEELNQEQTPVTQ